MSIAEKPLDQATRLVVDPFRDCGQSLGAERALEHVAPSDMRLAVTEQGRPASEQIGETVGGDPFAADESVVVSKCRPHIGKATDRVHAMSRQPDHGAGVANARERLSRIPQDRILVQVEIESWRRWGDGTQVLWIVSD